MRAGHVRDAYLAPHLHVLHADGAARGEPQGGPRGGRGRGARTPLHLLTHLVGRRHPREQGPAEGGQAPAHAHQEPADARRGHARHRLRVQGRRRHRRVVALGRDDPQVGDWPRRLCRRAVRLAAHPDDRLDAQRVHDGPRHWPGPRRLLHRRPGHRQDLDSPAVPRKDRQEHADVQEDVLLVGDHARHLPAADRVVGREAAGQDLRPARQQEDARLHRRHLDARLQRVGRPDHDGDPTPAHGVRRHVQPRQAGRVQVHQGPADDRLHAAAGRRQERHLVHAGHAGWPHQAPLPHHERDAAVGRLDQPDLRLAAQRAIRPRGGGQDPRGVGDVGAARRDDHLDLGGHQEEDAADPRQVPLHLQPARPLARLPGRLHVRRWRGAEIGHTAARPVEARVRARLRRPARRLHRQGVVRQDDQQAHRGPVWGAEGRLTQGAHVLCRFSARRRRRPRHGRGVGAAARLRARRGAARMPRARRLLRRPLQRGLQAQRRRPRALRRRAAPLYAHLSHHAHAARLGAARRRGRLGQADAHAARRLRGGLHFLPEHHHQAVQHAEPDGRLQAALHAGGLQGQGRRLHLHRQGDQGGVVLRVCQYLPQHRRAAQPLRARRDGRHLRRGGRVLRQVAVRRAWRGPDAGRPVDLLHRPRARQPAHRHVLLARRPQAQPAHAKVPRSHQRLYSGLVPAVARGGAHRRGAPLHGQLRDQGRGGGDRAQQPDQPHGQGAQDGRRRLRALLRALPPQDVRDAALLPRLHRALPRGLRQEGVARGGSCLLHQLGPREARAGEHGRGRDEDRAARQGEGAGGRGRAERPAAAGDHAVDGARREEEGRGAGGQGRPLGGGRGYRRGQGRRRGRFGRGQARARRGRECSLRHHRQGHWHAQVAQEAARADQAPLRLRQHPLHGGARAGRGRDGQAAAARRVMGHVEQGHVARHLPR